MPEDGHDTSLAQKRKRMYEINREAARFFHETLFSPEGKAGLDYYKSRGYSKKTLVRFGMGYAPDDWRKLLTHMKEKGYSYEELYDANLANRSEKNGKISYYDNFRNRVIVPIIDPRGNVVAFGGRVLDDSKPKYVNTSDTLVYKKSLGVFGLNFAKNSKEKSLILVEGYMDAISLHQAGFDNAIACLGTALTSEMAHLLSRYTDQIILSYDADEAGQKATQRAIGIFSSIGMKLKVLQLSGGKDPDEILKKYGPERFRSLIDGASNDIEFALVKAKKDFDLDTADGKMKYLTKACEILADTGDSIAQDVYASKIAGELDVEKQTVTVRIGQLRRRKMNTRQRQKFTAIAQKTISETNREVLKSGQTIREIKAQKRILSSLYQNPDFISMLDGKIDENDFPDGTVRKLFTVLTDKIKNGESLELNCFAETLSDSEMSEFVGIVRSADGLNSSKKEFSDCINVICTEKNKDGKVSAAQMNDEEFSKAFDAFKAKKSN